MAVKPETDEEAWAIAGRFHGLAYAAAHGDGVKAADDLREWLGVEFSSQGADRVWQFASVGPTITAAIIRKGSGVTLAADDFWMIETLPGLKPAGEWDESEQAVVQAVVANLNDDIAAAADIMAARFGVAGYDGLIQFVIEALRMCAAMIRLYPVGGDPK